MTNSKTNVKKNKSNKIIKKVVKPNTKPKNTIKKITKKIKERDFSKKQIFISCIIIFFLGVLLIFSSYAWFSTALNVKVKQFNIVVIKNSGLTISLDGINYSNYVELSEESVIKDLKETYPSHLNQWSVNGMTPVSSPGITRRNTGFFTMYASGGVRYKKDNNGFIYTSLMEEKRQESYNYFIAFDLFLKNITGSPYDDNLYIDKGTQVGIEETADEEMTGLLNSVRFGFTKINSVDLNSDLNTVQNMKCENACASIIYEPNNTNHTNLSIERAKKYGLDLVDGTYFPTYSVINEGGPIYVRDTISGSPNIDTNYFQLQNTITEEGFDNPLFSLPNAITKMRVYVWVEGQDIDSLETNSKGATLTISLDFIKDTQGYIDK